MDRPFLVGKTIYLRPIDESDVDGDYLQWVNDEIVYSTLGSLHFPTTRARLLDYIRSNSAGNDVAFFGIMTTAENKLIGTAKLGPMQWIDRHAYCALYIGSPDARGKGYGSEVVRLLLRYGFNVLNLRKISAGMVESNVTSMKIFEKVGMKPDGRRKEQFFINGHWEDHILMAMFQSEFAEKYPQEEKRTP
jgi:ribosomal-protein-alanine N-acetyltransferase